MHGEDSINKRVDLAVQQSTLPLQPPRSRRALVNARLKSRPAYPMAVVAIATSLGLQLMRVLLELTPSLLSPDWEKWNRSNNLLLVLTLILFSILLLSLNRILGTGPALIIITALVGLCHLALQLPAFDLVGILILAALGVLAYMLFLPLALGLARRRNGPSTTYFGLSFLAGISLYLAGKGVALAIDPGQFPGWLQALLLAIPVLLLFAALLLSLRSDWPPQTADVSFNLAINWSAIGPILFLQLLLFSNIEWVSTTMEWSIPIALAWLLLANTAAVIPVFLPVSAQRIVVSSAAVLTIFLQVILLIYGLEGSASLIAAFLLLGQITLAGSLLAILRHMVQGWPFRGLKNITAAHGLGLLILAVLALVGFSAQTIGLSATPVVLPVTAMLLVILPGLHSILSFPNPYMKYREPTPEFSVTYALLLVLIALMIVPAWLWRN